MIPIRDVGVAVGAPVEPKLTSIWHMALLHAKVHIVTLVTYSLGTVQRPDLNPRTLPSGFGAEGRGHAKGDEIGYDGRLHGRLLIVRSFGFMGPV